MILLSCLIIEASSASSLIELNSSLHEDLKPRFALQNQKIRESQNKKNKRKKEERMEEA